MDVIAWLLDSDPAIRWKVMRDLTDASDDEVARSGPASPQRAGARGCWLSSGRMATGTRALPPG